MNIHIGYEERHSLLSYFMVKKDINLISMR